MDNNLNELIDSLIGKDPNESPTAYSAFCFWATLPASERLRSDGHQKAADFVGLAASTIKQYKTEYRWDERANLIDAHFLKIQFQKRLELQDESNLKFAADNKEIQERAVNICKKALTAAEHLLDTLVISGKTQTTGYVKALQDDGTHKVIPTQTTVHMEAKASDVASLIRVAVETPMKTLNLPTETIKPAQTEIVANLSNISDEDLAKQRAEIQKERERLTGKTQNLPGVN